MMKNMQYEVGEVVRITYASGQVETAKVLQVVDGSKVQTLTVKPLSRGRKFEILNPPPFGRIELWLAK